MVLGKRIGVLLQAWIDHVTLKRRIEDINRAGSCDRPASHKSFLSFDGLFQEGTPTLSSHVEESLMRATGSPMLELDGTGE